MLLGTDETGREKGPFKKKQNKGTPSPHAMGKKHWRRTEIVRYREKTSGWG